jgi:hypothetical protein
MSTEKGLKYGFFFIAGVAVILGVVLLGKKKPDDDDENPNPEPTPMDPVIDPVQASVPQNLATILASKDPIVALKGRKIYAKVVNAKGRKTPYVNDGMVNNLAFESLNGEYLGYPTRVGNDLNGAKDASGKVYKWIRVTLDTKSWNRYNDTKSFLTKQTFMNNGNNFAWFREDVIKL